jgi:hypothetical protein
MTGSRALPALLLLAMMLLASAPAEALGSTPVVVPLGAATRGVAVAGGGSLAVIATADGVFGFTPSGTSRFHSLAGMDVAAVAVNDAGTLVAAGDGLGLVHFLDANGAEVATGLALGAVNAVDMSASGGVVAVGTSLNYVHSFNPAAPLPPPLPGPPANPANLLLPQWSYRTIGAVSAVQVSGDGAWVSAANRAEARGWLFANDGAALPGGGVLGPFFLPCGPSPYGPKCWFFQISSGGQLSVLSGARTTYDMIICFTTGFTIATRAGNWFNNPWNFASAGAPAAGMASADGTRYVVGDSFGNLYELDNSPAPGIAKTALWSANLGAGVTHAALTGNGALVAASTSGGSLALFSGSGSAQWTASVGGATGLAFTRSGSALVGSAGNDALFWT